MQDCELRSSIDLFIYAFCVMGLHSTDSDVKNCDSFDLIVFFNLMHFESGRGAVKLLFKLWIFSVSGSKSHTFFCGYLKINIFVISCLHFCQIFAISCRYFCQIFVISCWNFHPFSNVNFQMLKSLNLSKRLI